VGVPEKKNGRPDPPLGLRRQPEPSWRYRASSRAQRLGQTSCRWRRRVWMGERPQAEGEDWLWAAEGEDWLWSAWLVPQKGDRGRWQPPGQHG